MKLSFLIGIKVSEPIVTNVGNHNNFHLPSLHEPHLIKSAYQASEVKMKLNGSITIQTKVIVPPEPIHFPTCHLN